MSERFFEGVKQDLLDTLKPTVERKRYSKYEDPAVFERTVGSIKESTPAAIAKLWKTRDFDIMKQLVAIHLGKVPYKLLLDESFSNSSPWAIALALEEGYLPLEHFLLRFPQRDALIMQALNTAITRRILLLKEMRGGQSLGLKMAARYFGHTKPNPAVLHPLIDAHIAALEKIRDGK